MKNQMLGELLSNFQTEHGIETGSLCQGLCSMSYMSQIKAGKRIPDPLLFQVLMERMGEVPASFSIMVTSEGYQYHKWKEEVFAAIESENWYELEQLLESEITRQVFYNEKLESQFRLYTKAILCAAKDDYESAFLQMKSAAEMTMQEVVTAGEINHEVGITELHMLLLCLHYGMKAKQPDADQGWAFIQRMERYVYKRKDIPNEKGILYPKIACVMLNDFADRWTENEKLRICETAIEILRKALAFEDITEILLHYVELLEKRNSPEVCFYRKQREIFCQLLESEGERADFRPERQIRYQFKFYITNEYLLSKRQEMQLTQEKLSEGICETETYSRIETGKRPPSRRNLYKLMDKLGVSWCYYKWELETTDLNVLKLRVAERTASIKVKKQESEDLLMKLKQNLDMNSVINRQYISFREYYIKDELGNSSVQEIYHGLEDCLKMTVQVDKDAQGVVYYSQTEQEIIGQMAKCLKRMGRSEEAIELIERVIRQTESGKLTMKNQWNGYSYLIRILSELYFEIGEYQTAEKISRYAKKQQIKRRCATNLCVVLDAVADNLEHMGMDYREEYLKLYRWTYYLADFYSIDEISKFIKKYYEDNFDPDMVWY